MKEMNEKEVLSAEEMGNLKGGLWVCIDGEWYWIDNLNEDPEKDGE